MVRPILNYWHPQTKKVTYWFPSVFSIGLVVSVMLFLFQFKWLLFCFILYFIITFILALLSSNSLLVSLLSLMAVVVQFFGYGYGFLKSNLLLILNSNKEPETIFPKLFFNLK